MFLSSQNHRQFRRCIRIKIVLIFKLMKHLRYDLQLLKHQINSLFLSKSRISLTTRIRIKRKSLFQFCSYSKIIHDQSTRFIFINPVNPCYSLHQIMTFHRLIYIKRMQTRSIKTGKPHIPYNNKLQFIIRILHTIS